MDTKNAEFNRRALAFFIVGFLMLVAGHLFLAMAGRLATNVPGRMAPFLIVFGYVVFGLGFIPPRHR